MVLMLGAGLVTGSLGLVSAGVESTGDVVAAVVTFFAVRLGARPADLSHPYGHRRAENLSALAEATILVGGGLFVAIEAIAHLSAGQSLTARWYVFAVIGVAIAINVSRALISRRSARRYHSAALRSNSFHFAGDVAGSVAVLIGLVRGPRAQLVAFQWSAQLLACGICARLLRRPSVVMSTTKAISRTTAPCWSRCTDVETWTGTSLPSAAT